MGPFMSTVWPVIASGLTIARIQVLMQLSGQKTITIIVCGQQERRSIKRRQQSLGSAKRDLKKLRFTSQLSLWTTWSRYCVLLNLQLNILIKQHTQIMIVTTCMDMTLKTLFKIIRARWDIENSIFNNLKTECGLEHCFVMEGTQQNRCFI